MSEDFIFTTDVKYSIYMEYCIYCSMAFLNFKSIYKHLQQCSLYIYIAVIFIASVPYFMSSLFPYKIWAVFMIMSHDQVI